MITLLLQESYYYLQIFLSDSVLFKRVLRSDPLLQIGCRKGEAAC